MGGITALYYPDGAPLDETLFERMHRAIAHRGRDGGGQWMGSSTALGFQTFHTTPEAITEKQPLSIRSGRLRIVFEGRIDNRDELSAELRNRGVYCDSDGDAELALRSYECWESDAPRRIIGDFAFVLWDEDHNRLFCARDPSGIRPFYYFWNGKVFLAASEIKQILAAQFVERQPNTGMAAEYLAGTFVTRTETLFRDVQRLDPGSFLMIEHGRLVTERFYDLDATKSIRYRTDAEYTEHFRDLFAEAIKARMRAIGPVGLHLSGGLDSTSVCGMSAALLRGGRIAPQGLETFSLVFPFKDCDEREWIHQAVSMFELPANYVPPFFHDLKSFAQALMRSREFADYPNGAMWADLWTSARERGFRVMLGGNGSDEYLSGGPDSCADLFINFRWQQLLERIRIRQRSGIGGRSTGRRIETLALFLRLAAWPMLPPTYKLFLKRRSGQPLYAGFADPDFARAERLPLRIRRVPRYPRGASFAQREFYRTFVSGWRVHALETNDLMAARFGIEERHPFNDRRLIEFLFAIPEDVRLRNGQRKFVLREAMRDVIPEKIRNRRDKADFSVVFWKNLDRMSPDGLFNRMELKRCGWLDDTRFRATYSEFMANYANDNINVWTLWTAFALELWYRLVILGQDVTEIVEAANAKVQQSLAN